LVAVVSAKNYADEDFFEFTDRFRVENPVPMHLQNESFQPFPHSFLPGNAQRAEKG
jgi:hypothetical protein